MRPPSKGWYTYDEQIRAELDNLRKALNEARSRGMSDVVNNKYPNINKVSELQPPKSTDAKVPKNLQEMKDAFSLTGFFLENYLSKTLDCRNFLLCIFA